jgi:hypothetical protein
MLRATHVDVRIQKVLVSARGAIPIPQQAATPRCGEVAVGGCDPSRLKEYIL